MNRPKVEANCCRNPERASELAGHADIRTTEVYFARKEEDAEVAARWRHAAKPEEALNLVMSYAPT